MLLGERMTLSSRAQMKFAHSHEMGRGFPRVIPDRDV